MNNSWKIYLLTLISFLVGTSQFVIAGILDDVATSAGVSLLAAGQLITAFSLATAIGTPVVMVATAKMGQRMQLLLALTIILLGTILTIALPGFGFLLLSRIVLGVGSGVFVVTAYATAANLAPVGRQAGAMSNVAMGYSASLVLGVPIGRVVAAAYDWKVIFWGIGLFTLLGIFAVAKAIPSIRGEASVPLGKQLALLKNPKISTALCVTFFVFIGYSVVNTYMAPFLTSVMSFNGGVVSVILFVLGIASLIGSKLGGFLADRTGTARTLVISLIIQALPLGLLSIAFGSNLVAIPLLVLWTIATWTFGPTQNFNLLSLAPEASGIMLSLNSTFVQLGFAVGAGIGGVAVGGSSIFSIFWIGAAAVVMASVSFGLTRKFSKRATTEQVYYRSRIIKFTYKK
ncbi:MFS transporter [Brevibacillus choshinensis]|uniref:MFS transporter n=1 Tax=Brevibacillus choshinensis TaxID=54911 RepID=A0ABR5N584_BRECH|nr:MFS transporter [Brevibacillus choshinensis]KQL45803.1 MFS transporter [Brevibacillus choshinensis]